MSRILVVDDEPIIALTLADWLTDLGQEPVGPANDLPTALQLCEEPLDAAILDVSLGRESAEAVARRLDERRVPFIVASGHDFASMTPTFSRGVALPKPFGFESFRRALERIVGGG